MSPSSKQLLVCSSVLVFAATASSQVVSPKEFTNTEGPTYLYQPLGSNSNSGWRYQQIHDDLKGSPMTINQLAFRRDSAINRGDYMSFSARVSAILSTSTNTAATMSTNFASNHGTNRQTVLIGKTINFPATRSQDAPEPFDYVVKFTTPYVFDGKNGLCWELQVSQQLNLLTTVYMDAAYSQSTNPPLGVGQFGTGCRHTTRIRAAAASARSSMNWRNKTGTMIMDGSELAVNKLALAVVGISRTNFGPLPLPLPIPGSQNDVTGTCTIYVSPNFVVPIPTTSSGTATLNFPIPADTTMAGFKLYGQWLVPDAAAKNIFTLIGSNAVVWNWVPPYGKAPVSRVYATNTLATTGNVSINYGLVTELR